jgi:hypothetical protein
MTADRIPNSNTLLKEIKKTHLRSNQYGIDPNSICNLDQVQLSAEGLEFLRQELACYYQVASSTMLDLYGFFPNDVLWGIYHKCRFTSEA